MAVSLSLLCLAFHLVAPVTSQVAAEAAGYQTSNKQENTLRDGGRSLPCSALLSFLFSLPLQSRVEERGSSHFPCFCHWQVSLLVAGEEEEEEEEMDL